MAGFPQIPGIEIEGELGRGAHSVVYRGWQAGVACAVKLPRTRARWTRWVYREAVALARVKHPSLPAVLEVGEIDALPYLVMELVEGVTLADKLEAGALDEQATIEIARQLAGVLAAVHDAGLVHRDVKPRNIVVERESGILKLVDFGFATPMERVGEADTAGTAAYAAPEQFGAPSRVDARTDLYALGRVLFECLTGQSLGRRTEGPWGREARAELVATGVNAGLAEIVAGLLERDADRRYPDGHALLSDLGRLVSGVTVLGPRARTPRRSAKALVGRRTELERVLAPVRDSNGTGAVALVRALRGGGKTRFLAAVGAEASILVSTVSTVCQKDDPPLSTLRRILESYFEVIEASDRSGAMDDVRRAIGNLASVAQLIAPDRTSELLSSGAPAENVTKNRRERPEASETERGNLGVFRARSTDPSGRAADPWSHLGSNGSDVGGTGADSLAEGAAEILLRLAGRVGPIALVVDDAQWMDPVSVDALVRVAHRVGESPVVLVLASRPDVPGGILERFSALRPGRSIDVELARLTEEQVGELVAVHLGEEHVDARLVARIHRLAGGTPLGVLEVLGAFLDAGVLRPHARAWSFDPASVDRVVLPQGALVLLGRRLRELPDATLRVLEAAAILGTTFDEMHLARVVAVSVEDLSFGIASAARAGVLEPERAGRHHFVHDSLREMLVEDLAEAERRRLHQRAADALASDPAPTFEELCAAAVHFAAGECEKDPARVYRVARAAGEAALARFDNETALRFHTQARVAAEAASIQLDARFFSSVGEASLRLGALDESEAAFGAALERATDPSTRAIVLGRLAWVYETRAEPERAWTMLGRAFDALAARMPVEDIVSATSVFVGIGRSKVGRLLNQDIAEPGDIEVLCELHYQNARLGIEYGKPARVIQSSLASVELSERGGSAGARARARALHGLVMTMLGRREGGEIDLVRAREIASREGDAATLAFCAQLQAVAKSWAGDLDGALVLFRECIDVHGPWLELREYCNDLFSCELIQSLRGRADDAWAWIARAVERLRRDRTRPMVADFLIHRARAAMAATGREASDDPWLAKQFDVVSPNDPGRGSYRLLSWGACARYYLETDDLGAEFEDLVGAFRGEGHNPRRVHLALTEFYVAVAHARVHQCLRAVSSRRPTRLAELRSAVADLRACARVPLLKAHARMAEGYLAWFEGHDRAAKKLLAEAEALADQQSCPWVLYGVARARAHMLRAVGKEAAARDQARVAELFARDHGAVTRARWVREEFALASPAELASPSVTLCTLASSSRRTSRQLAALLQIARAPRPELREEQQAGAILDELMSSLDAEHGALWLRPEGGVTSTAVERHRRSNESVSIGSDSPRGALLHAVYQSGEAWPSQLGVDATAVSEHPFDPKRTIAVPLFLYERAVGALCIERSGEGAAFTADDRSLLVVLSHQVPVALEVARLLVDREQLQASLQQAKKMEAIGQLAGGIAHDFNNMLAATKVALSAARERASSDDELMIELDIIAEATTRASQLTSQLLSFSRHQPAPMAVHDVNDLVSTLEPMLRRVVGSKVSITTNLSPSVAAVEVDRGSFDQALVNLLINARDAMPNGGRLAITTRNVSFTEATAQQKNVVPGEYVEVEIADSGEGMSADTLTRVFEPFFTTKPPGSGSGLGLAMVYAFTRNCGGGIDVVSEIGKGTQFRLYLRRAERARPAPRPAFGRAAVVREKAAPFGASIGGLVSNGAAPGAVTPGDVTSSVAPKSVASGEMWRFGASRVEATTGAAFDVSAPSPGSSASGASLAGARGAPSDQSTSGLRESFGTSSNGAPSVTSSASTSGALVSASSIVAKGVADTILVVDDDDLVRRSIAKILERNGYRVVAVSGSVEALSVAQEQGERIGLVILDVLMPGVTGPELGRRINALKLPAKLLFVSGFSPESIPIGGSKLAEGALLQKPFSQSMLLERVRQLMAS